MRSNILYQTLQEQRSEHDIQAFLKIIGSFNVKTPALHFNVETCRAQFIQPFWKIFVAVSFDVVTDATNKSMNGKHCTLLYIKWP